MQWLQSVGVSIAILLNVIAGGLLGLFNVSHHPRTSAPAEPTSTQSVGATPSSQTNAHRNTPDASRRAANATLQTSPHDANNAPSTFVQSFKWVSLSATSTPQSPWYLSDGHVYSPDTTILDADPSTFLVAISQNSLATYAKDSHHVFFSDTYQNSDFGTATYTLPQADPGSFRPIWSGANLSGESYGADDTHVYFDDQILPNADPRSFSIIINSDDGSYTGYVKDASHVWFCSDICASTGGPIAIAGADPSSFVGVAGADFGTAKDRNHVYNYGAPVPAADPASFVALCSGYSVFGAWCPYAKDDTHVWIMMATPMTLIPGADPATFTLLDTYQPCGTSDECDAEDQNHLYNEGGGVYPK